MTRVVFASIVFGATTAFAQLASETLPPMPDNPHNVHRCDLPARAAKNGSAPCGCSHYVARVQDAYASMCWRESGVPQPPFTMPMTMLPAGVAACMKTMPSHCEAIARGVFWWRDKLGVPIDDTPPAGGMYNRCATACYPNKCGCVDGACREHDYYVNGEVTP